MKRVIHDFRVQLVAAAVLLASVVLIGKFPLDSYWLAAGESVILNEVCCYNDTIIYDKVGEYNDYVEIYNSSSETIDISGFCLSDNKSKLTRYTFPQGSVIESGGYLVLWGGCRVI